MCKGYTVLTDAVKGLEEFLKRKGYESVRDIVGIASQKIRSYEDLAKLPEYSVNPRKAWVNREKCIECGKCFETCWFGAIEKSTESFAVCKNACTGCGNCEIVCPAGAIDWKS